MIAVLIAVPALVMAVLAAVPAEASSPYTYPASRTIAVDSAGASSVLVKCLHRTKTCTGTMWYAAPGSTSTAGARVLGYSVKARKSAYVKVYVGSGQTSIKPVQGTKLNSKPASLVINQKAPTNTSATRTNVTLENRIASRRVVGDIQGPLGTNDISDLSKVKITLWTVKGLASSRARTFSVSSGNTFSFPSISLGINNASVGNYRLSISAIVAGEYREWFWRGPSGGTGSTYGGGESLRDASRVRLNKRDNFHANLRYGEISGDITAGAGSVGAGAAIRVSAPPANMPTNNSDLRDLDIPYCANDLGGTKADSSGHYSVTFLPRSDGSDPRYMVKASPTSGIAMHLWNDKNRSCLAQKNYTPTTSDDQLINFHGSSATTQDFHLREATGTVPVNINWSGLSPTVYDRSATLREYIPGRTVLDSPVLYGLTLATNGVGSFTKVPQGRYWLEVGRLTSCNAWYKSFYPNNSLYLQGVDRGAERWKTVSGASAEYKKSYDMGYVKKSPPSGYAGWMYRGFCETRGTGHYVQITVGDGNPSLPTGTARSTYTRTITRGATISGHVSRGSKSNKEMLVSVYSTKGVLVMRTAYSSRSGNFTVRGLPSGNYNVMVNADSWRGIGRTFTGPHSKRVTAGHSYSVGTLGAKF